MTMPPAATAPATRAGNTPLLALVVAVFFLFGGITNLNDLLVPKLKGLFALSYTGGMLVQFAFFTSYALVSIPAGLLMQRLGYFRGLVLGFGIMAAACLLFIPAANSGQFVPFLVALFLLGGGITLLQVAVNPLILALGPAETASSRLTFAQFFNSLGVFLMIRFGAEFLLGAEAQASGEGLTGPALDAFRAAETQVIGTAYTGLAIVLVAIALFFWSRRRVLDAQAVERLETGGLLALLARPRLAFGALCIFVYVGAEVGLASIMVAWLGDARTLGLAPRDAGVLLSYYWLGALAGRMAGGFLLRLVLPGRLLAIFAGTAIALCLAGMVGTGAVAGYALVAVGLANSIMFPTIFSLATQGLDAEAPQASGILCTAIVGGALVPLAIGAVADSAGLILAPIVAVACYAVILGFGLWTARAAVD